MERNPKFFLRDKSFRTGVKKAQNSHVCGQCEKCTSPLDARAQNVSSVWPSVVCLLAKVMPKVKTNRVKYPEGWELIEPTLSELQAKMREAENDPHDGKRKCEALWPIFKIAHQKSRYIFDLYHRRKEISKELYEFCMDQGYADRNLIAKWKKPGYERLCCLRCIQPRDHNFQTTCVCRVPQHLREEKVIECVHCGCKGCASGD